jgi:D-3-phosphoglycerate dehydrogenase
MSPHGVGPETRFKLAYFGFPDPVAEQILGAEPRFELFKLTPEDPPERVSAVLAQVHGFQVTSARSDVRLAADKGFLARCPHLLVVSTSGAGYDTVDVAACSAAGIIAVNQTGLNKLAVAEHVVGMMLALSKQMIQSDRALRRDRSWTRVDYRGEDIQGKTIGIVGIGNIGTRLATICRDAFAMEVLACDPYLSAEAVAERGARKVSLEELLAAADFVSINCPLTAESRGMIGAGQFRRMKPTAYFINTARGGIHDEAALAEALAARRLAGAGLDVWDKEPPPLDHPLLRLDNVLATPHNAGVTRQAYRSMAEGAARQLVAIAEGSRPPRLINPEAWAGYRARFERVFGRVAAA